MNIRKIFYVLISFVVSGALLWYVYKGSDLTNILENLKQVDRFWLTMSILLGLMGFLVRAYRWIVALRPLDHHFSLFSSLISVILGYFVNLFVPRLGEIIRCSVLKKMDKIAVDVSFGAIITERIIDLLFFFLFLLISFITQFSRIRTLLVENLRYDLDILKIINITIVSAAALLTVILILRKYHARLMHNMIYKRVIDFLLGLKKGLSSIRYLNRTDKIKYWSSSILIWVIYYFMFYTGMLSVDIGTIDFEKITFVFTAGCIGMILPTPGGVGSFHLLTAASLASYGVEQDISNFFALVFHGAQYVTIWIIGLITALVFVAILYQRTRLR